MKALQQFFVSGSSSGGRESALGEQAKFGMAGHVCKDAQTPCHSHAARSCICNVHDIRGACGGTTPFHILKQVPPPMLEDKYDFDSECLTGERFHEAVVPDLTQVRIYATT